MQGSGELGMGQQFIHTIEEEFRAELERLLFFLPKEKGVERGDGGREEKVKGPKKEFDRGEDRTRDL